MSTGKKLRSSSLKLQEDETYYTGSNISYSDDDDDNDSEYQSDAKNSRTNRGSGHKIERKPTRVPNLKIQNRNALLARENRKRKKEMMENLEKDVNILHDKNRRLHKIIKTQNSQMKKLNKEIYYLKSVLKNQTQIVSILKSLNTKNGMDTNRVLIDSPKSSSDTLSCNSSSDDEEAENIATEWDEILKNPLNSMNDFIDIPALDQSSESSPFSEISTEHNYSHYQINHFDEPDIPGICLHINTGRVSLEYCSVCHQNASNS
ncbi:CREB/ATF bZIP transcription factor-like isoform X2 [Chironomus tepperi]|uniref:CREB/ATF bZIP transcription factor-like isoform X2 n=1 Tax=Chironomus tepperi TaxID=113505 RepID=UPI00391FC3AF